MQSDKFTDIMRMEGFQKYFSATHARRDVNLRVGRETTNRTSFIDQHRALASISEGDCDG